MSLVKVPFVLLAALFNHISTTPPVPPPQPDELVKDDPFGEPIVVKTLKSVSGVAKLVVWAGSLCEVAVLLARANPSFELGRRVLSALVVEPGSESRLRISRTFVLGCMLGALGGFIRIQCYRTLGRFFTYELALRNNHRLVTSGPYGVVRHPSYIGLIIGSVGTFLCHASGGTWLMECTGELCKSAGYAWTAWTVYTLVNLVKRTATEDKVLKKSFGKEWASWAESVPYRLIPGIHVNSNAYRFVLCLHFLRWMYLRE